MRSYTVASASFVLDVPVKWLDNVLSRHAVSGVQQTGEGGDRLISAEALDRLFIARVLNLQLRISAAASLALAEGVLGEPNHCLSLGPGLELRLSHGALRAALETRAADQSVVLPRRRGRPRAASDKQ